MTTYTAEDFKKARFAEHPETGQTACRIAEATGGSEWTTEDGGDATDETLARVGWVPVMELGQSVQESIRDLRVSRDTQNLVIASYREREGRLRADVRGQAALIGELRERLQANDDVKDMLRGTVDDLREKVKQIEATQQSPLAVADLEAEWESAEIPDEDDPIREGDEYIASASKSFETNLPFVIGIAGKDGSVSGWTPRILSRAPQREPWQDLANDLRQADHPNKDALAENLHALGWRKGGDDE